MKIRNVVSMILAVILGLALSALILVVALKVSFYHEQVFDFSLRKSNFADVLKKEINENAKDTITFYDLSHVLDIEEALSSFDWESEVIRYFNLRMKGIETELDNKAFRIYLHKMIDPLISAKGLKPDAATALSNEIENELLLAYNKPFLYSNLTTFLNSGVQYNKLLNTIIYILAATISLILVLTIFIKKRKIGWLLYTILGVTFVGCVIISFVLQGFKVNSESLCFSFFITSLLKTASLLMQFVWVFLIYLLLVPVVIILTKFVAKKLGKNRGS